MSEVVALVELRLRRSVRVIDLVRDESLFSDDDHEEFHRKAQGLQIRSVLGDAFGRPTRPSDEARDYLSTQLLANKLATSHDGILYPSAQRPGDLNLVLFDSSIAAVRTETVDHRAISSIEHKWRRAWRTKAGE